MNSTGNNMLDKSRVGLAEAMRGFAMSVSIISTSDTRGNHYAMTATAVASVSLEPESMLVCINKSTLFHNAIEELEMFCVNLLAADQASLSKDCSGGLPQDNRVNEDQWVILENGLAVLKDSQLNILCRKSKEFEYGTHNILIGDVYDIRINRNIDPLLYLDGSYGGFREFNH